MSTNTQRAILTALSRQGDQTPDEIFNAIVLSGGQSVETIGRPEMRTICNDLFTAGLVVREEVITPRKWHNVTRSPTYKYTLNIDRLLSTVKWEKWMTEAIVQGIPPKVPVRENINSEVDVLKLAQNTDGIDAYECEDYWRMNWVEPCNCISNYVPMDPMEYPNKFYE